MASLRAAGMVLLAATAAAQSASAPQLPVKPGEWKMIAIIHREDGDQAQSFFTCNEQTDLAHFVPQPAHLPAGVQCRQDSQTLTADGELLTVSCKSADSLVKTTYDLTRNSDSLVTGTMKLASDSGGRHTQSSTNIVYQWQKNECVNHEAAPAAPQSK